LTIAAKMNFELAGVDEKKAYHQSGRAPGNILVRPPAEWLAGRRSIWRLLHLPYGLVDAGRQRQLAFERWLLDIMGFVTVPSMPQVFVLLDPSGSILLLLGKDVDGVIIAGAHKDIERFLEALKSRWIIAKAKIANRLMFNGALIERDPSTGAISMSTRDYVKEKVHVIPLTPERRRQQADATTAEEKKLHHSMAGVLGFLGQGVLPMVTFMSSVFLQKQPRLTVFELDLGNRMIKVYTASTPLYVFLLSKKIFVLLAYSLFLMPVSTLWMESYTGKAAISQGC
jgi:hypothetical protein